MTPGELAYLSMAVVGFVSFALALFAVERIESRKLASQRGRGTPRRSAEDRGGALHA